MEGPLEAFLNEALSQHLDRIRAHPERLGRLRIRPVRPMLTLIHLQQDLSTLSLLLRDSLLRIQHGFQFRPLLGGEPHDVSLLRHSSLPWIGDTTCATGRDIGLKALRL